MPKSLKAPKSPAPAPSLAELRKKAYGAWEDHKNDMRNDPEYRDAVVKRYGKDRLKDVDL